MTEGVWIAVIAFVQAVTLALVSKIGRDSGITRREVKNSHTTNLREDLDKQHDAQMGELRGMRRDIGRLDVRDIERGRELRDLASKVDEHLAWSANWSREQERADRELADRIEDTLDPRKDSP